VARFAEFVRVVYGADTLEENLRYIAVALTSKTDHSSLTTDNSTLTTDHSLKSTPREVIRSYFLNDFYKDHLRIYQKRPIYWLFDSGKKNGFKALIYMHRYSRDTLAKLRTDYVHEQQSRYRTQLSQVADAIQHADGAERVKLGKRQAKLTEQAEELAKYEEKIKHFADMNIEIDLDDGVKHNYGIFAEVLAKIL
jgi:type II restriction/modification system DNA methylase subunit YeeA